MISNKEASRLTLIESKKTLAKASIDQLHIITELEIVLVLSG